MTETMEQRFIEVNGDLLPRQGVTAVYLENESRLFRTMFVVYLEYGNDGPCYQYAFTSRGEAEALRDHVKFELGWRVT